MTKTISESFPTFYIPSSKFGPYVQKRPMESDIHNYFAKAEKINEQKRKKLQQHFVENTPKEDFSYLKELFKEKKENASQEVVHEKDE